MAKRELEHISIEHLGGAPEMLRLAMAGLTETQTLQKPAAHRWSVAEILEHLSHVEGHYFRPALDAILSGGTIEPYDQTVYDAEGRYSGREPEESFAHWEEQWEDNLQLIRGSLEAFTTGRTALHPQLGRISLEDLLNEWAIHDLGHVRQILELVRALIYYPKLGPFQPQYRVAP